MDGPSPILVFIAMRAMKAAGDLGVDECRFQPLSVDWLLLKLSRTSRLVGSVDPHQFYDSVISVLTSCLF